MMVVTTEKTAKADEAEADETEADGTEAVESEADGTEAVESEADGTEAVESEAVESEAVDLVAPVEAADEPFTRRESAWRHRPWRDYVRRGLLPALLAASVAVSGFLGWQLWQEHQEQQAGQQALQAAVIYAGALTSLDANNVDQNFREVLEGATGEFKDMYTRSSVHLRQLLIDNKASAHGVVVQSAIQSQSANQVVVLLFIDQTVTNTSAPDPRIDRSRIKMTMEKVDGRWRASKVQLL